MADEEGIWTYEVVYFRADGDQLVFDDIYSGVRATLGGGADMSTVLATMGDEGWELVTLQSIPQTERFVAVFKSRLSLP